MITLQDISVIFDKNTALETIALNHIDLAIMPGDFVTLVGGNGAGKSTLLGLIAGEIRPTVGKIFFDGKEVTPLSVEGRASDIGYVYQDPRLGTSAPLTIEENLALAVRRGKSRGLGLALNRPMRQRFQSLLEMLQLGLENRLSDRVATLSGGQRQALSLVMATLIPPKILLLDEHTAALDPKTAQMILAMTQKIIAEHQMTAIMITHHLAHAFTIGNRTVLMQEGKIIHDLNETERQNLKPEDMIQYF